MPEAKATGKKPNVFATFTKAASKFFRDCKGELKRIVWPTKKTVFHNMGIVLVTVLIASICIFALDTVFMYLLGLVMDVAN